MAGKSIAPLLLLGGAAVLAMGGKKKKKGPDIVPPLEDLPPPPPAPNGSSAYWKTAGNPPGGKSYDPNYWGSSTDERIETIRKYFSAFGYPVEIGPWPMNKMGPLGTTEVTNEDGTKGKIGGGDDGPANEIVRQFQRDYNIVSKAKKFGGSQKMGGLNPDGYVGYYTLNGLRFVKENLNGKLWQDAIQEAKNAGGMA